MLITITLAGIEHFYTIIHYNMYISVDDTHTHSLYLVMYTIHHESQQVGQIETIKLMKNKQ